MKKYLRLLLVNLASLWLISSFFAGIRFSGGFQTIILAAVVLTLANLLVKPLVNILLLPINLLTMGLFRWLINVVTLYLVVLVVPRFEITSFLFPGFSYQGFIMPEMYIATLWAYVLTSFLISLITSLLLWLIK